VLCGRVSDKEYCSLHRRALENMVQSYEYWRKATSIGWREYLGKIKENPNSGIWVVEVCTHLLSKSGE